ncbi:MAG: MerR family DNA-binding transcriptional regulator [Cyanobacteria bacterium]|nr:MerR family DNA-binding transcriptional regulator [Cyanobacteriota bacterium]
MALAPPPGAPADAPPAVPARVSRPPVGLRIGEVAEGSGLPVKTIRFYSDAGLILPTSRTEAGYRLFDQGVYAELSLIRTLKALEIPLVDIKAILAARRVGVCSCDSLRRLIENKRDEIQGRLTGLEALRQELTTLLRGWEDCGRPKPAAS